MSSAPASAACCSDMFSIAVPALVEPRDKVTTHNFGLLGSVPFCWPRTKTLCPSCRHCWNVQRAYGCSSGIEGASVLCCDQGGHLSRACAEAHLGHPSSNPQEAWCEEEALHGESPTPPAPSAGEPRERGIISGCQPTASIICLLNHLRDRLHASCVSGRTATDTLTLAFHNLAHKKAPDLCCLFATRQSAFWCEYRCATRMTC